MIKILKLTIFLLLFGIYKGNSQSKTKQQEVYNKIVKANLKYPRIVLKQAIHESAHFKSKAAINKNNILGIMESYGVRKDKIRIRYFDSIDECIKFYKNNIQNRYNGGDYYRFLKRIGYAEDVRYIQKIKDIPLYLE